jgi:hypothetical protein
LTDGPEDDIPAIRRFRRQWWPAKRGLDVERMAECFAPTISCGTSMAIATSAWRRAREDSNLRLLSPENSRSNRLRNAQGRL